MASAPGNRSAAEYERRLSGEHRLGLAVGPAVRFDARLEGLRVPAAQSEHRRDAAVARRGEHQPVAGAETLVRQPQPPQGILRERIDPALVEEDVRAQD